MQLGDRLPYMNFYRFCQLLEQSQPDKPVTGSTWQTVFTGGCLATWDPGS